MGGLKKNIDDDIFFEKGFKKNYGFWLKLGGMFNGSGSAVISVVFLLNAPFIEFSLFETVRRMFSTDLTIAIESFHFAVFIVAETAGVTAFLLKRDTIISLYKTIGKGFYDYEDTLDEDCLELLEREKQRAKKLKRLLHNAFVTIVMSACVTITIIRPAMKFYWGEHRAGTPEDGVVRMSVLSGWTPFEKSKWYAILLINVSQYIVSSSTPGITFGATFFVVFSCEELRIQLILLGKSLKNVNKRVERLDMPKEKALRLCLKHSVRHHQMLFKFKDGVESVISVPAFILVLGFTLMMCMCGYMFVSDKVSMATKMVYCLFLLSECLMFYQVCHFGEEIKQLSEGIGERLYESDWTNHGDVIRNYMLIIHSRSKQGMVFSFCGLIEMTRETFATLTRTSYSYFNLMLEFN